MKKILCIFFCLLPILGGKAQTLYKDQVRIEKESITRSEDNNVLTINLDIVLKENLKLESNNVATLTPFLEANGKTKVLSSIVYTDVSATSSTSVTIKLPKTLIPFYVVNSIRNKK